MRPLRIAVAILATAAAITYVALGFCCPEWVGLRGQPVLLYLAGPALVIAAILHLLLVLNRRW